MSHKIEKVAVIGAGTMGAAIAAHAANAGYTALLLDIVPREPNEAEAAKGLTLESPEVRNRIVRGGFDRIRKIKPASFVNGEAAGRVSLGNLEDDFDRLAEADWIVEAVIERLDVKRSLMEKIEAVRKPGAIVTTNTSGIPIASIVDGRSEDFRRHFFGTHLFNPPRYMKLLEIIPGSEADPAAVAAIQELATRMLGKGTIRCKDTPNFIGNRILSIHGAFVQDYAFTNGYSIEEVDALTGPLIGRPKTATFRLQDLVGIDVAAFVAGNLYALIPEDESREVLRSPETAKIIEGLVERGRLGNKTGSGFYKKAKDAAGQRTFLVLDPETFAYREPAKVRFEAVGAVRKIEELGDRLRALFDPRFAEDRGARFAWAAVSHLLSYAAARVRDIAYDLPSLDNALRWGFSYEQGPFELWDSLGVAETADRMEVSGVTVAPWVREMLAAGCPTFYRREQGRVTGYYDWESGAYRDLERDPRSIRVEDLHLEGKEIAGNGSASLLDLGEDVLLLEIHAEMNAIDDGVVAMLIEARRALDEERWKGLVIGNDGPNFCVGANLVGVGGLAAQGDYERLGKVSKAFQEALQALRHAPKAVVAAVHAMALGGGAEIALGAQRVVAASESYLGLVEAGVGLVPGGGGIKELVRRQVGRAMAHKEGDPLPAAQKILETVGMAKVSTSAAEARELGFLAATDRIVMNRDHLLFEARREVLVMAAKGSGAPGRDSIYAGGRDLYAALKLVGWTLQQAGFASAHDALIADKVAYIISGGDLSAPQWVPEEYFLDLERRAFVDLVATEKTQDRIRAMLETGRPLRN